MSSTSRVNSRPALPISTLPPLDLDLPATGSAWLTCPDCKNTVEVIRGLVQTHKPNGRRCEASHWKLEFDLTPAQHAARRIAAREVMRPENQRYLSHTTTAAPQRPRLATVLGDGRRPATRRTNARAGQHTAERRVRTTMAEAFEDAWEKVARIPVAPAAQLTPGRTPHPAQTSGWAARRFTATEMTFANAAMAAKRLPAAA
ncbi:MAG TPA: hypothetical protein VGS97_05225 [Actinocrinis sp.]|uniref:hypothetical protein n=1 Tax=Actinocrinis sp. TaxID=1920516 RepID=UPI002DDD6817|nr:hypothetical protein [Actinocrinis sp.]HEV2343475.1 hypothetical protein [Actinocrinis sp.]